MESKKQLTKEQLLRRLVLIKEDVESLYEKLDAKKINTSDELSDGCSIDTHLTNILVVTDVDENGCVCIDSEMDRVETDWMNKLEFKNKH